MYFRKKIAIVRQTRVIILIQILEIQKTINFHLEKKQAEVNQVVAMIIRTIIFHKEKSEKDSDIYFLNILVRGENNVSSYDNCPCNPIIYNYK